MISPVVAGLDKISETEYAPVVCTYDSIGYREHSNGWECAGTASELLSGCAESYYRPNLEPEELFDVISNCLLSGIDRVNSLLGIEGVTPHTFRHTWATRAAEDGVAMETIADFLGDTVETIKKNYLHLSPDYLRSAINRK